jgi:hypothetical protein
MYGALSSDKGAKHLYDYGFIKQEDFSMLTFFTSPSPALRSTQPVEKAGMALRTASTTSTRDSSIQSVIICPAFMVLLPLVALEVSVK